MTTTDPLDPSVPFVPRVLGWVVVVIAHACAWAIVAVDRLYTVRRK